MPRRRAYTRAREMRAYERVDARHVTIRAILYRAVDALTRVQARITAREAARARRLSYERRQTRVIAAR